MRIAIFVLYFLIALAAGIPAFVPDTAGAAEIVRIGGTGLALAAMRGVGEGLAKGDPGIRTEVLPSLGTQGGIKALLESEIEIAIAARPLKPEEKAMGAREAACATTALVFTSHPRQEAGVTRAQLPGIYAAPSPSWPDGTPLKVILRSRDGSENAYLIETIPGLEPALAGAYKRPGMPVAVTDQENADIAQKTAGSLAVMTLLQLRAEALKLSPLALDGVEPNAETIASGAYPMPLRFCLVVPAKPTRGAERFLAYLGTSEGAAFLRRAGAEPFRQVSASDTPPPARR